MGPTLQYVGEIPKEHTNMVNRIIFFFLTIAMIKRPI